MRDAFFNELFQVASRDKNILVLTADHGAFALKQLEDQLPSQFINVGISEQNMVGVAAGLAASSKIVFIYGITPFVSLRVLEQLTIDVAAMQLPVNIISVGAGFTYSTDGPTHHGLQDVTAISSIPGITILNSSDPENTKAFVNLAIKKKTPHYIRIEKEKLSSFIRPADELEDFNSGISVLKNGNDGLLFFTTGQISHEVLIAANILEQIHKVSVTVIDIYRLKDFPDDLVLPWLKKAVFCFCISELYETFLEFRIIKLIVENRLRISINSIAIPEKFYFVGDDRKKILSNLGLDSSSIIRRTLDVISKEKSLFQ